MSPRLRRRPATPPTPRRWSTCWRWRTYRRRSRMRRAGRWPPSRGNRKQVAAPRRQGDEQPLVRKLVTVPLEDPVVEQVGQGPAAAAQAGPVEPDPSLGGLSGEVDHHQVPAGTGAGPGPGEEI